MTQKILRLPQVKERVGLGHTAIYSMMRVGKFPSSIKITDHAVGWTESSIDEWIDTKVKKNNPPSK